MSDSALPGLYIHVPFCSTKCSYCDFYSITDHFLITDWLEALTGEVGLSRDLFPVFDSVYLGGGTPTVLGEGDLGTLLEKIHASFSITGDAEITVEANPDDLSPEKARSLRSLGFNRLSLGVQSFDDPELAFLFRRHSSPDAVRACEAGRSAGFTNIGLDLMYGLPGQTLEGWQKTLETALSLEPDHLSCYQLTLAEGTPLWRRLREESIPPIGEEEERRFFLTTSRFLTDKGFIHYEVSNYSKTMALRCRHNMKYWNHTPYLGLGPSAHSFDGSRRWWNVKSVEGYCRLLASGASPAEGSEILTETERSFEDLILGFRTMEGVSRALADGTRASALVESLEKEGFVKTKGDRIVPTTKGFLVADRLPLLFS